MIKKTTPLKTQNSKGKEKEKEKGMGMGMGMVNRAPESLACIPHIHVNSRWMLLNG